MAKSVRILKDGTNVGLGVNIADTVDTSLTPAQYWANIDEKKCALYVNPSVLIQGTSSLSPSIWFKNDHEQYYGRIYFYGTIDEGTAIRRPSAYHFLQYTYDNTGAVSTAIYEDYRFPIVTKNLASVTSYEIVTTKTMAAYSSSTIAYVTNSHLDSVSSFYVYRMGRFGIFQAAGVALKAYGTSSWINVATIPEGYRPLKNVQQRMPGAGEWVCRIMTTGAVDIYKSSTSATTAYFSFPFPLDY